MTDRHEAKLSQEFECEIPAYEMNKLPILRYWWDIVLHI